MQDNEEMVRFEAVVDGVGAEEDEGVEEDDDDPNKERLKKGKNEGEVADVIDVIAVDVSTIAIAFFAKRRGGDEHDRDEAHGVESNFSLPLKFFLPPPPAALVSSNDSAEGEEDDGEEISAAHRPFPFLIPSPPPPPPVNKLVDVSFFPSPDFSSTTAFDFFFKGDKEGGVGVVVDIFLLSVC